MNIVENLTLVSLNTSNNSKKLEFEFFQNFESEHTRKSYRNDLNTFFEFMSSSFKGTITTDIQKLHIIAYKDWLTNNQYAPKSINRKISTLSTFYRFLIEKNHMSYNPCEGVKKPKQAVKSETNDLSDEEVIKVLEIINEKASTLHKAVVFLFFSTGIRKSELINLKLKDYKEINGEMTITINAKGGKTLLKFLPKQCSAVLDDYINYMKRINREIHQEDWIFQPSKNPTKKNANLVKPMRPKSIDYIFIKYCKLAGVNKKVSPHSARATYIGSALQNGANIVKVSKDVGHSSVKTTEEYNKRRNRYEDSPINSLGFLKEAS